MLHCINFTIIQNLLRTYVKQASEIDLDCLQRCNSYMLNGGQMIIMIALPQEAS